MAHAADRVPSCPAGRSSIPRAARRTRRDLSSSCWRAVWAPTTSTTARTIATRRRAWALRRRSASTSTVELEQVLTGADMIFVIGANPSSNHPRFIHMLKHRRDRGGDVVVINPAKEPGLVKFAVPKSPVVAALGRHRDRVDHLQPRIGSDLALFKGLMKAILAMGSEDKAFIAAHCSGFDAPGPISTPPRCNDITARTGLSQSETQRVATRYAERRNVVFAWGMGMTHHVHGTANVEAIANLALIRGMLGGVRPRPCADIRTCRGSAPSG